MPLTHHTCLNPCVPNAADNPSQALRKDATSNSVLPRNKPRPESSSAKPPQDWEAAGAGGKPLLASLSEIPGLSEEHEQGDQQAPLAPNTRQLANTNPNRRKSQVKASDFAAPRTAAGRQTGRGADGDLAPSTVQSTRRRSPDSCQCHRDLVWLWIQINWVLKFYPIYDTIRTFNTDRLLHGVKELLFTLSDVTQTLRFS